LEPILNRRELAVVGAGGGGGAEAGKEFLMAVHITGGAAFINKTADAAGLRQLPGLFLVSIGVNPTHFNLICYFFNLLPPQTAHPGLNLLSVHGCETHPLRSSMLSTCAPCNSTKYSAAVARAPQLC
jgi:hypothetical protein